jgi:hypothetical protein
VVLQAISLDRYESERPTPDEACRVGDARFLALRARALADDPPQGDGR